MGWGQAGTEFTIRAEGYDADEEMSAWLNMPDGGTMDYEGESLGTTDDAGTASFTWESPEDLQPGDWSIVVRGRDSRYQTIMHMPHPGSAGRARSRQPCGINTVVW